MIVNLTDEIWKDIPEYEGLYQVSNLGRIKSLGRIRKNSNFSGYFQEEKLKLLRLDRTYYLRVSLWKDNKCKLEKNIHRIVAETFLENPNKLPCVNHIDGNKLNNKVSNLEWCSYSENNLHAWKNKLNLKRNKNNKLIIAIDADGTIITNKFPEIGEIKENAKKVINKLYEFGHQIIIWTCRYNNNERQYLTELVYFLNEQKIKYDEINKNIKNLGFCPYPKIYADFYIDDRNIFCEGVDWYKIEDYLKHKKII